jgi:hypothetical protein
MSGRNQHFIPRMLLRGFQSDRSTERRTFVWMARRQGGIFEPNIAGVAAQNDFYSSPSTDGLPTLDDAITAYETRLANLLLGLRGLQIGEAAPGRAAAEVVSHLTMRVAGFRHFMGDTVTDLVHRATEYFAQPSRHRSLLGLSGPEPTPAFCARVVPELREDPVRRQLPDVPEVLLIALLYAQAREGFDDLIAPQLAALKSAFGNFAATLPDQAAASHRQMLAEDLVGAKRMDDLVRLSWRIAPAPEGGCILPDCVALGVERENALRPYVLCDRADLQAVVLPLDPHRLLLGVAAEGRLPDLSSFNASAASASDEFFVSHVRRPDMADLKARIGSVSAPFRADLIEKALREFEAREQSSVGPRVSPAAAPADGCRIDPPPWPDGWRAAQVVARVKGMLRRLSEPFALDRLHAITFASDPVLALVSLDRGDARLPRYVHAALPEDLVAASPILVRDGKIYSHSFIHADVAEALIGDDADDVATALHIIVHQLAEVSAARRIDQALPGFLLAPIEDPHLGRLLMPVMPAVFAFHAAWQSAGFGSEGLFEQRYRQAFVAGVESVERVLAPLAEGLKPGDDLSLYYETALGCCQAILVPAAHLAGHRSGLGQGPLADDPELRGVLDKVKLGNWFEVFSADLADLWEVPGSWRGRDEFVAFRRHTERMLWAMNVIPTRLPDGGTWLLAPDALTGAGS